MYVLTGILRILFLQIYVLTSVISTQVLQIYDLNVFVIAIWPKLRNYIELFI